MSASGLAAGVRAGRIRATDLVGAALARARSPDLGAFLHLDPHALARAAAIDLAVAAGVDPGPLAGVPVAIKDNLAQTGHPCGCASRVLEGYIAPYTATAVSRLEAAGAVIVGRTNMDELAMGSSTETSACGPAKNPWDADRVPGGSSGGSAVAVACDVVPIALGSDTGGSARQPAALCGVVGIKPTYGRVSRHGLVAFASSLDQISPIGRTVRDVALALRLIAGPDPMDGTSAQTPLADWVGASTLPIASRRVGVPVEAFGADLAPGVAAAVRRGLDGLAAQGADIVPISLPSLPRCINIYEVLSSAEASSNLARFEGPRYGPRAHFGPEVQRRILLGAQVLSADEADGVYRGAQAARQGLRDELDAALARVDAIATPTSPTVAFRLGERASDPRAMARADLYTVPASLTGHPAISVPVGLSEGLPVGLQLIGRRFDEATLLTLAGAVEREIGLLRPELS